jgi:pimeloyl-ACP methyl ester carboxylesterase
MTVMHVKPDMNAPRPGWQMPEERAVSVMRHRIAYWEKGAGKPLVLMHGFSGSGPFEWGRVIDALAARGHRVIALQCIGFAPSETPDIVYSTKALTDHLGGFFTALGLGDDITLVGESFGGWLVGEYAVRAAKGEVPAIAKLVIVGGPIGKMQGGNRNAEGFVHQAVKDEFAAWSATYAWPNHEPVKLKIMEASGLTKGELDQAAVAQLRIPVLLLWGDKDALIPLATAERALGWISNARLTVFEGIGHIPSVECPNEFVAAVDAFARA